MSSIAWIVLTATDLNAASVAGKVARIQQIATTKGMPDPVPAALGRIVAELRAAIGFSGKYSLDADEATLPPSLRELAVMKCVRECEKAVSFALTADEKDDETEYKSRVKALIAGQWPVETPLVAVPAPQVSTGPAAQVVSTQPRRFTRGQMTGL